MGPWCGIPDDASRRRGIRGWHTGRGVDPSTHVLTSAGVARVITLEDGRATVQKKLRLPAKELVGRSVVRRGSDWCVASVDPTESGRSEVFVTCR